jgi:anti-sigma B factor antagonist
VKDGNKAGKQSEFVNVDVQRFPTGKSVVRVSGELIRHTPSQLTRIVEEELMRAPSPLVLDLSGVTHINATGVDALVSAATAAGESDISFCLVGVEGRSVGAALAAAELTELFELFPSVNDAD